MLRRAVVLKRICDRRRAQNASGSRTIKIIPGSAVTSYAIYAGKAKLFKL